MADRPTPEQIALEFRCFQGFLDELRKHDHVIVDRSELKVAVCECLIDINNDLDPVNRKKWGPIIPPTAIDWIGDRLVDAILTTTERATDG